ncbi:phage major capsid protein [Agromyces sp. NPDC058064]|uniref:phage major capsid protein n=1 Tax=Agromyces sp. NPDC058064 TaxID=3346322 RepID=UPI0036DAAEA0
MAHPLLERAAQHTAQARAINDEFEGKAMPAEAASSMKQHLAKASEYRSRVEAEAELKANEAWISEPQYKHDMTGGGSISESFGHGEIILESERKELQRKAFHSYLKHGIDGLSREEKSALVEDSTSGGQNLVPSDFAGTITKEYARLAVIRNLAAIRPTTSNKVDVGSVTIAGGGWGKLEFAGSTTTDGMGADPNAAKDTIEVFDLTALVKLGVDELDDADTVEAIIRDALAQKFAEQEDDAFAFGNGSAKPTGIAFGSAITQKVTAGAADTLVGDDIIKLAYAVPAWATRNAVYLGNGSVAQAASLLKDSNGGYLWKESLRAGEPATLNGYAFHRVDGLPAITASTGAINTSLVFGDVRQGYLIADRAGITVQRLVERYADEGKVGLLFKKRVGGGVIRPKAFSALII